MLALAHKRDGKLAEARAALRKIPRPDANVVLQMGLLSVREGNLAQAEEELARAWQMDQKSFAAAYNLALTRLSLGQFDAAIKVLWAASQLAPTAEQKRLFAVLAELGKYWRPETPGADQALIVLDLDSLLENLDPDDEQKLIRLIRNLGNLD